MKFPKLAESGAIDEYVLARHGQGHLRPTNPGEQLRYTFWLHYAEGSLRPHLVMKLVLSKVPQTAPFPRAPDRARDHRAEARGKKALPSK